MITHPGLPEGYTGALDAVIAFNALPCAETFRLVVSFVCREGFEDQDAMIERAVHRLLFYDGRFGGPSAPRWEFKKE